MADEKPRLKRLGHIGLHCFDVPKMRDFYTRVLGLQVTDEVPDRLVFLSSDPAREHHEMVLTSGRTVDQGATLLNQMSFHVDSVETLQQFLKVFKAEGVKIQRIVTHGIALAIYSYDPEGNVFEVYWDTHVSWPQPYGQALNLEQSVEDVLAEAKKILAENPPRAVPAGQH